MQVQIFSSALSTLFHMIALLLLFINICFRGLKLMYSEFRIVTDCDGINKSGHKSNKNLLGIRSPASVLIEAFSRSIVIELPRGKRREKTHRNHMKFLNLKICHAYVLDSGSMTGNHG